MGAKLDRLSLVRLDEVGREAEILYKATARLIVDRLKHQDEKVKDILEEGFQRRYTERTITAKADNQIVGGLLYGYIPSKYGNHHENDLFINYLCTLREYEGLGIGRALLTESEAIAREINISRIRLNAFKPLPGELDLVPWYTKLGFEVMGISKVPNNKRELVDFQKLL